jgi:hypothetical protein
MAFDPERYEREVIRPMRGRRGPLDDDDLTVRYAIEPGLTDLPGHLRRLRTYWNQTASGPDSRAQVCRRLLAADEDLRRGGAELTDPTWWRRYAQRRETESQQRVAQVADDLKQAYGATGRITRAQAEAVAGQYQGLDRRQVALAVRQAGLRLTEVVELPADSGLDRAAYRELGRRLHEAGVLTVVQLLHPDLAEPFTLVQSAAPMPLDAATLRARIAEADRAADSPVQRARRAALRLLETGLRGGADLRVVALFQVVETLAEQKAKGLADALLIRQATRMGLAQEDADLVVASLPAPAPVGAGTAGAAEIRDLLAGGRLRAAQAALAALPATDPERAVIAAELAAADERLAALLGEAEQAVRDAREERAERLLTQARRIAADDPEVRRRAERLPIPPPGEPRASVTRFSVRLDWHPPQSGATGLRYRVVRGIAVAPSGPLDGSLIAETAAAEAVDEDPPVARDVHYAVFAAGAGTPWSRAATTRARVTPPAADVRLRAGPDQIALRWLAHPAAVAVRVTRSSAGAADLPLPAGPGGLVDRDVREGVEYRYAVVAVYLDEDGTEVAAPAVTVTGAPRPEARPLDELRIEPVGRTGAAVRVRVLWPVRAGPVRVRYSAAEPPWESGTVLAPDDAGRWGAEIAGVPGPRGQDLALEADVPPGPHVFVPFTAGSSGVVVGRPVHAGAAEPVEGLSARRTGDVVTVTWVWPADTGMAEVGWARPEADDALLRLTRTAYRDGGGCVLPVGPDGGVVTVRAVAVGPAGESLSEPVSRTVPPLPVRVRYSVRPAGRLRERLSGGRILQVVADRACDGLDLAVVAVQGHVKPLTPAPGTVIRAYPNVRLTGSEPLTLPFRVPKLARPFWIRCFVTRPAGVTVIDPPVAELRVT